MSNSVALSCPVANDLHQYIPEMASRMCPPYQTPIVLWTLHDPYGTAKKKIQTHQNLYHQLLWEAVYVQHQQCSNENITQDQNVINQYLLLFNQSFKLSINFQPVTISLHYMQQCGFKH